VFLWTDFRDCHKSLAANAFYQARLVGLLILRQDYQNAFNEKGFDLIAKLDQIIIVNSKLIFQNPNLPTTQTQGPVSANGSG
jgi:hypothetical protein